MHALAALPRSVEAGGKIRAVRLARRAGVGQPRLGEREPQQQAVVARIRTQQRHDLGRAAAVEQKIGVGALQVSIMRGERERGHEMRFRGCIVTLSRRDLRRDGQCPFAHRCIVVCAKRCGHQRGVGRRRRSRQAGRRGIARRDDKRRREACQCGTVGSRIRVAPDDGQDDGPSEPRLRMRGSGRKQAIEIDERAREVMLALLHSGAQQQHRLRNVGTRPPRRERCLRLAEEARITARSRRLERSAGDLHCARGVARTRSELGTHTPQRRERRVALLGQRFENDRVARRDERRGGDGGHERECQDEGRQRPAERDRACHAHHTAARASWMRTAGRRSSRRLYWRPRTEGRRRCAHRHVVR